MSRHDRKMSRRTRGSAFGPGDSYVDKWGGRESWPHRVVRGHEEGHKEDSFLMVPDLNMVKDVVLNTVESVYPWMGITVGVVLRKNPVMRIVAPLAGFAIGIARALSHTDDKIVAETVTETSTEPPPAG